jgi:S1-C subfamily serine protease
MGANARTILRFLVAAATCLAVASSLGAVRAADGASRTNWLTTRTVAAIDLHDRFHAVATVSCAPETVSPTSVSGTVRYWKNFWCDGETRQGVTFRLLYEATGKCAACWTISRLTGAGVGDLRGESSAPSPQVATSPGVATGTSISPEKLFGLVAPGMLFVTSSCTSGEYTASAFLVGPRTIVTALHVLQDPDGSPCSSTVKQEGTGRTAQVTTYESWKGLDLAVANLSGPIKGFNFSVAPSPPSDGQSIVGLGYSLGNPLSLNQGTVSSRAVITGIPYLFLNLLGGHGSSGGPVLDSDGQVIGLTQRGETNGAQSTIRSIDLPDLEESGTNFCVGAVKAEPNTLCRDVSPGAFADGSASTTTLQTTTPTQPTPSWPPDGYIAWNSSIAYKWLDGKSCVSFAVYGCWQIDFITTGGCPDGLFVTLDEYENGAVIGSGVGTLPNLPAKTVGKVEIDADQTAAKSGKITQIDCYNLNLTP